MSSTLDKYRKVKALAERGATAGERSAARAAMERIEQRHPDLKEMGELPWPGYQPYYPSGRWATQPNIVIIRYWA